MIEKINEYLNATIKTKKNMQKRIFELEKENKDLKLNSEKLIKDKDKYKTKLSSLNNEFNLLEMNYKLLTNDFNKVVKKIEKEKNYGDTKENKRTTRQIL